MHSRVCFCFGIPAVRRRCARKGNPGKGRDRKIVGDQQSDCEQDPHDLHPSGTVPFSEFSAQKAQEQNDDSRHNVDLQQIQKQIGQYFPHMPISPFF